MGDNNSYLVKSGLGKDQKHTDGVGTDRIPKDLTDAQVTIARLDEKNRALEEKMKTEVLNLRGEIKTLKLEHSQCANLAKVMDDLKGQVDRLSVKVTINDICTENYSLRIAISELQDRERDQKKEIGKHVEENREMLRVMDQQRTEINNFKEELDAALDENIGLTQAHERMTWRTKGLWKEIDRLTEALEEKKDTQPLQDTQSSDVEMWESKIAALKRLLKEKE